jgi:uncharacterized protein (DUF1810 family)
VPTEPLFREVLDKWFDGLTDDMTDILLTSQVVTG